MPRNSSRYSSTMPDWASSRRDRVLSATRRSVTGGSGVSSAACMVIIHYDAQLGRISDTVREQSATQGDRQEVAGASARVRGWGDGYRRRAMEPDAITSAWLS